MTDLYVEISENTCEISDEDGNINFCYMSLKDAQIIVEQLNPLIVNKIPIHFYVKLPDMKEILYIDLWFDTSDDTIVITSTLDIPVIVGAYNSFHGLDVQGISFEMWERVKNWISDGTPMNIITQYD